MAYLDHIDPGNAVGSVIIPDRPAVREIKGKKIECPECEKKFKNVDELENHFRDAHPILEPYLIFKGQNIRKILRVRERIGKDEIKILNAEKILINNEHVTEKELKEIICSDLDGIFTLKIINKEVISSLRIEINIANKKILEEIDEKFLGQSTDDNFIKFREVNEIAGSLRGSERDYASALSLYLNSLGLKEKDVRFNLRNQWSNKLGESLKILQSFSGSAIAESIFSIAAFNENRFESREVDQYIPKLKNSKLFFQGDMRSFSDNNQRIKNRFPIDKLTEKIITFASEFEALKEREIDHIKEIIDSGVDKKSKDKLIYLIFRFHERRDEYKEATNYKKHLTNNPFFRVN